jgi:hypothetical protein
VGWTRRVGAGRVVRRLSDVRVSGSHVGYAQEVAPDLERPPRCRRWSIDLTGLAAATATLFGLTDQTSAWSAIAALPVAAWELSLGVWMVVKGFRPSPILAPTVPTGTGRPPTPAA